MITNNTPATDATGNVKQLLWELGFAEHTMGYKELCIAVQQFSQDREQAMVGELYPYVARRLRLQDWRAVENGIRRAIRGAWLGRDHWTWQQFFPDDRRPPSNKHFIAALAERLES